MEKMNKHLKVLFFFALGLSIGFPIGVVCIVFGAVKAVYAVMVLGIILAVAGFYVMPILWIKYGEKRKYRTILYMILNEHIYTVQGLASQTNYPEKDIRNIINYLILANYLVQFLFHNDTLELNTNQRQSYKNVATKKCSNCGAMMKLAGLNYVCDYCGNSEKNTYK